VSDLVLVGYAPKRLVPPPAWLVAPGVALVASASDCVSPRPEGWIDRWTHNRLGLWDTVEAARAIVPPGEEAAYDVLAFRMLPVIFTEDGARPFDLSDLAPTIESPLESLGFDAVSATMSTSFECSPLSCNGMARSMAVNAWCLFRTEDEAFAAAEAFLDGDVEPGPYWVVEVLRVPGRAAP
jgi:hypothetical protein